MKTFPKKTSGKTLKMMDGVRQSKRYPETFSVPDRTQKVAVRKGDYVKLCFINPDKPSGDTIPMDERMWVMVTSIDGRKYFGKLHNEPRSFRAAVLKYGQKIEFESRHILDIIRKEEEG